MQAEFLYPERLWLIPVCAAILLAVYLLTRGRGRKHRISFVIHQVIALLTALAIAGFGVLTASPEKTAWLILDQSASVDAAEVLRLGQEALASAGGRKTGVIVFGREAAVERPLAAGQTLPGVETRVDAGASDLEDALELAETVV